MSEPFDIVARSYGQLVDESIAFAGRSHEFYLRAKADALADVVGRRIGDPATLAALDVGCGDGEFDRLLPQFERLDGVDPSAAMVERARSLNARASYRVADGTALPYEPGEFDLTFAVCVLHHVEVAARERFASELRRVTRAGGLVVVFEHNPFNPLTRLAVNRCPFDVDAQLLRRGEVSRLLACEGLRIVERRFMLFVPWRMQPLERMLAQLPLGAQHYVAAAA